MLIELTHSLLKSLYPPDKGEYGGLGDLGGVFAGVFLKNTEITAFCVSPNLLTAYYIVFRYADIHQKDQVEKAMACRYRPHRYKDRTE